MTPLCWEHWIDHYRATGYEVLAFNGYRYQNQM